MSHTDTGTGTPSIQTEKPRRFQPDIAPQKALGFRMQPFRFHTEPFPQKNPEAFAPGFFFTLCNTRNLPCPLVSGNRAKNIKEQGNGRGPRSGLGKERRDTLYIRSFPPHSSHQKVASCPVAWASSRKRRRRSAASVFSILCMANPAWIMI